MRAASLLPLALALALGCGGPWPYGDGVELVEHCGTKEPVRLLRLDPGQYPSRNALHGVRRVRDRLLYFIETYADGVEFPAAFADDVLSRSVHATGPCGEDPALVAEDVDFLFDPRHAFGDAVLACRRVSGDVLVLDPTGHDPPRTLLSGVGCSVLPAGSGIVGVQTGAPEAEIGDLVFRRSLSDPEAPVERLREAVLAPGVETGFFFADIRRLGTTGSEVLSLLPSGELWRVDVETGSSGIELADVGAFELSYDGGFILWQPGPPVVGGEPWPLRDTWLRDRTTGEDLPLGQARFGLGSAGVQTGLVRASADFTSEDTRVVLLPELTELSFPPDEFVNGRHPESGLLLWSPSAEDGTPGPLHVLDPVTGKSRALFDRYGSWMYVGAQFLMLEDTGTDQTTLWERWLDDTEPAVVATEVYQPFFASATYVASVGELGADRHGSLELVDRTTGERAVLDDRVNAFSARLNWLGALEDAFAYAVDDEGRRGIWAARAP